MQNIGKLLLDSAQIGSQIRLARERLKMSQEELAQALDKAQRTVSQYERGERKISALELVEFAEVLQVPILFFYEGEVVLEDIDKLVLKELQTLPTLESKQTALNLIKLYAESLRNHLR